MGSWEQSIDRSINQSSFVSWTDIVNISFSLCFNILGDSSSKHLCLYWLGKSADSNPTCCLMEVVSSFLSFCDVIQAWYDTWKNSMLADGLHFCGFASASVPGILKLLPDDDDDECPAFEFLVRAIVDDDLALSGTITREFSYSLDKLVRKLARGVFMMLKLINCCCGVSLWEWENVR